MEEFESYIAKDLKTKIVKCETFQNNDVKYGVVVTGHLWYSVSLYCNYPLKIIQTLSIVQSYRKKEVSSMGILT